MCELMSAAIPSEDLDFDLEPDELSTMNEFEIAWKKFMKDHPELVPEGKREKHIRKLQSQVTEIKRTQTDASVELQKQLDFFEKSRETMERLNKKELEEVRSKQMKNNEKLQKQLDSIAVSEHCLSQAIPWEHFLSALDKAAETTSRDAAETDQHKKAKPSARALYLVDYEVGDERDERDIDLRACQIDHALLDTQVKMLQKQAQGYEKLLETQATLSKFLKDYNT